MKLSATDAGFGSDKPAYGEVSPSKKKRKCEADR